MYILSSVRALALVLFAFPVQSSKLSEKIKHLEAEWHVYWVATNSTFEFIIV